jgi:hypothetical protein
MQEMGVECTPVSSNTVRSLPLTTCNMPAAPVREHPPQRAFDNAVQIAAERAMQTRGRTGTTVRAGNSRLTGSDATATALAHTPHAPSSHPVTRKLEPGCHAITVTLQKREYASRSGAP